MGGEMRVVLALDELGGEAQEAQAGLQLQPGVAGSGDLERRQEAGQVAYRGEVLKSLESQIGGADLGERIVRPGGGTRGSTRWCSRPGGR